MRRARVRGIARGRSSPLWQVALLIPLLGCGGRAPVREVDPADMLTRAERSMARKDYVRAIEDLTKITADYPGAAFIDRVVFLLGKAHMETQDFVQAEAEFRRLGRDYPFSEQADDAFFLTGECYYRQRGSPQLDPTMAETALRTFNRFLDEYPDSPLASDARARIQELREFLAEKKYLNGRQYYRHKRDDAAMIYLRAVYDDYPEAQIVPEALHYLARAQARSGDFCAALETVKTIESLPQIADRGDWLGEVKAESADWICESATAQRGDGTGGR